MARDACGSIHDSQEAASDSDDGVRFPLDKYTVGWICALKCELKAARTMLDEEHPALRFQSEQDGNNYLLGRIGPHNVAITSLPQAGTNRAATAAKSMQTTFPNIRFCLMVGVGGGVPSKDSSWNDIRLGDIVVSEPTEQGGGVIQYDMGRREVDGFRRLGTLNKPPGLLLSAMKTLDTTKNLSRVISDLVNDKFMDEENPDEEWTYPKRARDVLFDTDHYQTTKIIDILVGCGAALFFPATYVLLWRGDPGKRWSELSLIPWTCCAMSCVWIASIWYLRSSPVRRSPRQTNRPKIHYGNIGSGNSVVKNAVERDELAKRDNVICFEMEAAGIMDDFPCLVIRGISDYADSYKRWDWQPYAAAVAAAYGKRLLLTISPIGVREMKTMRKMRRGVQRIEKQTDELVRKQQLQEEEKYLNWLNPIDHGSKHRDVLRQRQAETGQWVLQSEEFHKWLSTTHRGTLLCLGMPGAGKTFIAATIIDHLQQRFRDDPDIAVIFIYFDFNRQYEQTADSLIESLVKQLARLRPGTLSHLYQDHQRDQTRPSWEEILKTLDSVAASYSRVFLVVDAVDECQNDGPRKRFLQAIFDLQARTRTNILGTSRHDTEIQQKFQNSTVLEIHARNQDIERYIDGNMYKLPDFVVKSRELAKKIKKEIVARVDGMFLLATLYVNLLIGQISENDLIEVLSMLPTGGRAYDEAYERCMERIERQIGKRKALARKLLTWVTCAQRPLKESELEHALAVKIGKSSLDKGDIPQEMVEVCAGLVRMDPETREIQLVHFTTKEYFQRTQERWFPDAHDVITMTCITYLGLDTFQSGICKIEEEREARLLLNPLYSYAAEYWGRHARHASQIQEDITLKFLIDLAKTEACAQAAISIRRHGFGVWHQAQGMTGLHIVAYFGLNNILELLLQAGCELNARNNKRITPLSIAAKMGWLDTVRRFLVEKDIEINATDKRGRTALTFASEYGHSFVVKELLEHSAVEINVRGEFGGTALSIAAEKGHAEVVKLLLKERNININTKDDDERTALALAAKNGRGEVVELLLATADTDIDHVDVNGQTALMLASIQESTLVVKWLLDHGAAWEKQDKDGRTALHVAVNRGFLEGVKLLASERYKASLEIQDNFGFTALHLASQAIGWLGERGEEIVAILLANGANPSTKTFSGMTVEDVAVTNGQDSLAKLRKIIQLDPRRGLKNGMRSKLDALFMRVKEDVWNSLFAPQKLFDDFYRTKETYDIIFSITNRPRKTVPGKHRNSTTTSGFPTCRGRIRPPFRLETTRDNSNVGNAEILYEIIVECLDCYFKHLAGISAARTGINLLEFYVEKWNAFTGSAFCIRFWGLQVVDWVEEQQQIGRNITQPYRLCFQHWRNGFFLLVKERLFEVCQVMQQNGQVFDFKEQEIEDKQVSQDFQDMLPSNIFKL